jgi:alkanesulfonate monooxygenase SsuD/methylene tetrahydromethanopterin reductase-like flavin-dependent oxidoreductase (luciferase family)
MDTAFNTKEIFNVVVNPKFKNVRDFVSFALKNCDAFFVATAGSRTSLAANAAKVAEIKAAAAKLGRQIEVFTVGQVICRPSQQEAEDYYRHVNIEHADWGAIDGMLANKSITPRTIGDEEYEKKRRYSPPTRSAAIRSSVRPIASPRNWPSSAKQACAALVCRL